MLAIRPSPFSAPFPMMLCVAPSLSCLALHSDSSHSSNTCDCCNNRDDMIVIEVIVVIVVPAAIVPTPVFHMLIRGGTNFSSIEYNLD
jgi:hypothetical protein